MKLQTHATLVEREAEPIWPTGKEWSATRVHSYGFSANYLQVEANSDFFS
jgi:hypothetical protein